MGTGFRGAFVLSWSQTELDGLDAAPVGSLQVGASWAWRGEAVRIDGPNDVFRPDRANEDTDLRRRAARKVGRLLGAVARDQGARPPVDETERGLFDETFFTVTNGARSYRVTLIPLGGSQPPLLMFVGDPPPRETELWVVERHLPATAPAQPDGGVICFTPGTLIATDRGLRPVEVLAEGDRVLTRDNGPQQVCWVGARRMTGARLHALPHLRPVRIGPGAFGIERPDQELLVSPQHRLLVRGPAARALFNTPEVLVAARDLVNDTTITVQSDLRAVTYVHLLLPSHQVIWANGVETESFHPASADLGTLADADRARLLALLPEVAEDPHSYGGYARRNLTRSESALLHHGAA
ncbi:Hint domain-containing protein [Arenibacterium halophilum]|uniref:Hint domain-containing protein n=1 Tax=Arenibacterium halophilum TaxID=2583821 RepID=A0ABY2X789_9RHOB|nr:Hint domain-containing protein [Arenibacterium halophilum]TMV11639.1 Hint domain-containing protein [Arenibacterium halophilum]